MTLSPEEASGKLVSHIVVSRDDIARAKDFILAATESGTDALAEQWLQAQVGAVPKEVDIHASTADDTLALLAKAYGLRLSYYQAVWELVTACELFPGGTTSWQPSVTWRNPWGAGALNLETVNCLFPSTIQRPPLAPRPPSDPDLFLQGAECAALHDGIREAVAQSLACFRRGLYLPAIVMLAAGAEAAWTECGVAVARKLGNEKLRAVVDDALVSISRKVGAVRKALEEPKGKTLVKAAGTNIAKVTDAELCTSTLRERRNALHWGKAGSFIVRHSDASSLMLAAPLHLGTLEALRRAASEGDGTPRADERALD